MVVSPTLGRISPLSFTQVGGRIERVIKVMRTGFIVPCRSPQIEYPSGSYSRSGVER